MKYRPLVALLFVIASASATAPTAADVITLYDVSIGNLPGDQGWVSFVVPPATQSHNGSLLNLDTTASRPWRAGYSSESLLGGGLEHPLMPILDRQLGFRVEFDFQVISEGHDTRDNNGDGLDDRAGFSVIVISEDLFGLELAFFENRIWAYAAAGEGANSLFTQAEGVDFDATDLTSYDFRFHGSTYELLADGSSILSGDLRNYNPSGVPPELNPYDNPSFIFLGDNTTAADSNMLIGSIVVTTVPEPNSGWFVAFFIWAAVKSRRRQHCCR